MRWLPPVLLLVGACARPLEDPSALVPVELPAHFQAAGGDLGGEAASTGSAWWLTFDNPGLRSAVENTLAHNHDLRAASARVQRAEALARAAGGQALPQISAGLAASRSRQNLVGFPFPGAPEVLPIDSTNFGLSLDLTWELDLWGRLRAVRDQAEAQQWASLAELQAARLSLGGQAAKTWLAWTEAEAQLALAWRQQEVAQAVQDHLQERFVRGAGSASALRQARADLHRARAAVSEGQRLAEEVGRQLQVLQGSYPAAPAGGERVPLPALPAAVPAGLPVELMARRPDLAAAEAGYRAAAAGLREAQASLYPRLALTASGGTASNDLTDLVDGDFKVWSFAGNLLAPVFQGGRLRANVAANQATVEEAAALFAQRTLVALAEVEGALQAEVLLLDRLHQLRQAASLAEENWLLGRRRFEQGVTSPLESLQAESAYLRARAQVTSLHHFLLRNRVDLHLALGGGFTAPTYP